MKRGQRTGLHHAAEQRLQGSSWKLLSPSLCLQGGVVGVMALCVPQARCVLRHARELLIKAVSPGQEALRGQSCAWSCLIQSRSRGRAVPGECSCKMKPTNPGREHLGKGTQGSLHQNHPLNLTRNQ